MGHLARMREMKNACKILVRKPGGKNHSKDLDVDKKIIVEWIRELEWESVDWMRVTKDSAQ